MEAQTPMLERIQEIVTLEDTPHKNGRCGEGALQDARGGGVGARILIVEDELIIAEDLRRRLSAMGHSVVGIVSTGEAAVACTTELLPDLVLMDISLHGELDGVNAALAIQSQSSTAIVYVTGHGDSETMHRAKATVGFSFVLKPIDDKELRYVIEMALFRRSLGGKNEKA
jgi:CheY-like chemotaxis protein